eukprot:1160208-Pelagomonas_calceolata.AAC.1
MARGRAWHVAEHGTWQSRACGRAGHEAEHGMWQSMACGRAWHVAEQGTWQSRARGRAWHAAEHVAEHGMGCLSLGEHQPWRVTELSADCAVEGAGVEDGRLVERVQALFLGKMGGQAQGKPGGQESSVFPRGSLAAFVSRAKPYAWTYSLACKSKLADWVIGTALLCGTLPTFPASGLKAAFIRADCFENWMAAG